MIDTGSAVDLFDPDSDEQIVRKIPTEIYSRVCGYYRPTMNFNPGKKREFKDRVNYNLKKVFGHPRPTIDKQTNNPMSIGS